jgi:Peroxin-3
LSRLLNRGGFPGHSDTHEPAFTALLEETRDLLTSPDFALVLERALDRATSLLFDGLSQNVFVGDEREEGEVRLRTASVLPGLARWSSLALNGLPNELVDVRVFLLRRFIRGTLHANSNHSVFVRFTRGGGLRGNYILKLWGPFPVTAVYIVATSFLYISLFTSG